MQERTSHNDVQLVRKQWVLNYKTWRAIIDIEKQLMCLPYHKRVKRKANLCSGENLAMPLRPGAPKWVWRAPHPQHLAN